MLSGVGWQLREHPHREAERQVVGGVRDLAPVVELAPDGEGGLVVGPGPVDLAVPVDDPAQHLVPPGADRARGGGEPRAADERGHQRARLAQVAALLPEAPDPDGEPDRELGVAARVGPLDGGSEVRVLALELVQRDALPLPGELRRELLGEREVRLRVACPCRLGVARRLQALQRVLADRLQHREARLAVHLAAPDEALVDERRQAVEHVRRPARHGLGAGEVEAPHEHGQALEQLAHGRVEELVAPHDRAAQRPLAQRDVGRASAGKVEPALEALVDRRRREEPEPRRGELDGQRHAAQVRDDRRDVRSVGDGDGEARLHRAAPGDEQPDGLEGHQALGVVRAEGRRELLALVGSEPVEVDGRGEAGHRVLLLAGDAQRGAARREDPELPGAPQQLADVGGRATDLLEVVEDEQRLLRRELAAEDVDRAAGGVVADPHGVRRSPAPRAPGPRCRRSPRTRPRRGTSSATLAATCSASRVLPVPPGPVRVSSRVVGEQGARLLELPLAPDERRQLGRQVVGTRVERPDRREVGRQAVDGELGDPLRPQVLQPVRAERPEREARRQPSVDERRRRLGQQDLAAVAGRPDPRGAVDVVADVGAVGVQLAEPRCGGPSGP